MTFVVGENCIKCKYTDCVEVCPVDCFYEGPTSWSFTRTNVLIAPFANPSVRQKPFSRKMNCLRISRCFSNSTPNWQMCGQTLPSAKNTRLTQKTGMENQGSFSIWNAEADRKAVSDR